MTRPIIITSESACDIHPSELEKIGVKVAPCTVAIGEQVYKDWVDLSATDLFACLTDRNKKATTAGTSQHEYRELFSQFAGQDVDILHISVANNFSVCYNNAVTVAQEFPNVMVFDSNNVSSGLALAIYRALELRDQGLSVPEIIRDLTEYIRRIHISIVLDTVDYVRRGGRLPATVALGVEILKIKPEVNFLNGKISLGKKYRGNLEKVLKNFISDVLKDKSNIDLKQIILPNTILDSDLLHRLQEFIASLQPFEKIKNAECGCVLSTHAGPNAFGLAYLTTP